MIQQLNNTSLPRVLIIGLDGASFEVLKPLMEQGDLPTISNLIKTGVSGTLKSTLPPVTIPAWVSMFTGKNPGKIGVFDLLKRVDYHSEPNISSFDNHNPIWLLLNKYGINTGLLNIPGTYPPSNVKGFMITGMLTPSKNSDFTYPKKLGNELNQELNDYILDVSQWQYFDHDQFIKDLYETTEKRRKAIDYLNRLYPCQFNMMVYTGSDRIQHVLFNQPSTIHQYWKFLDKQLSKMLVHYPENTNVFIVSDHGFGPLRKTFFVNRWLRKKKYLRVKGIKKDSILGRIGHGVEYVYRVLGWILGRVPGVTKLLSGIKDIIGLEKLLKLTYDYLSKDKLENRVAWKRTKAFSSVHSPHFGQIYINKKGKMPRGIVKKRDVGKIREWIIEDLKELRDPNTDEPINLEIFRSEEIYNGQHLEDAPDIIFMIEDGTIEIDATVEDGEYLRSGNPLTGWTGTHTRNGIIIANGPHIKKGATILNSEIYDLTPTVLHLYGIPIPEDIDGKVLLDLFDKKTDFIEKTEISGDLLVDESSVIISAEDKALIEDRLRRLGYIS
jgi:predicted AlkP superfamily phosphohydrolase/phosphomutase